MKICFIGSVGHVGQAYAEMKNHPQAEFVGAAPGSSHETALQSVLEPLPYYPDYRRMLDETKPDVAVLSPVYGLTGSIAMECARRGIHVFAEKPIAATPEELDALEAAVRESGIRVCAMHYLRFTPAFFEAEKLIRGGAIGDIRMVTAQKSYKFGTRPDWYWDDTLYPGIIPWVGIHVIDCIYHLTGRKFTGVRAVQSGSGPQNAALCQFTMEDSIIASVNMDFLRPADAPSHEDDRIRVAGTEGVIEVRDQKIYLINGEGTREIEPGPAPSLGLDFLLNRQACTNEDIFAVTRAAVTAQRSAAINQTMEIRGNV